MPVVYVPRFAVGLRIISILRYDDIVRGSGELETRWSSLVGNEPTTRSCMDAYPSAASFSIPILSLSQLPQLIRSSNMRTSFAVHVTFNIVSSHHFRHNTLLRAALIVTLALQEMPERRQRLHPGGKSSRRSSSKEETEAR
jgi:hypothetical protein